MGQNYNVSVGMFGGGTLRPTGWYAPSDYTGAAIQSAINSAEAAGGGTVQCPDGDYTISSFLTIDGDNVSLVGGGHGTRFIAPTGSGDFVLKISAANASVRGITFVGGVSSEPAAANECISLLSGAVNTHISDCKFTGDSATTGFNVQIRGASGANGANISNNYFERVVGTNSGYGYGIQLADMDGGVIANNVSIQTTTSGRHHVYLSANISGFTVTGNVLTGGTSGMIDIYATGATDPASRIVISGNTLDGLGTGGGTGGAIGITDNVNSCKAIGNIIYNSSAYGIKVEGAADAVSECLDNSVIGNTIHTSGSGGIYVLGALRTQVCGNKIHEVSGTGILLRDTGSALVDGSSICGNHVTGSSHTYALDGNGSAVSIMSNHLTAGSSGTFANISPGARKVIGNYTTDWPIDISGSGTPESAVSAPVGSIYRRTDGGAGTSVYVKESGTGNTGWVTK